jgi:cyclophilin family peptidyl-prolyl cis-trans isomerase
LSVVFLNGGEEKATPSANQKSATPSPTPSATGSPGSNCGYTKNSEATGSKGPINPPAFSIDVGKSYVAVVKTSMGTFSFRLLSSVAPCTVNSFVYLAKMKYFDGLTFHRIIKDFVNQGGDPTGTGSGGPGYTFNDELANNLTYQVGTVAMANSGPNTNGSQFFVVAGQQGTALPKKYTIFGDVLTGLDVVKKINSVATNGGGGPDADRPKHKVTIDHITIEQS